MGKRGGGIMTLLLSKGRKWGWGMLTLLLSKGRKRGLGRENNDVIVVKGWKTD